MKKTLIILLCVLICISILCCCLFFWISYDSDPQKFKIDDDKKIVSFHVFFDSGSYKRTIQPISRMLNGRDYLYRFVILNEIDRYPKNTADGLGLGVPHTTYLVRILDDYGGNTGLVGQEITLSYISHPQIQLYRMPRLLENKEYLIISEKPDIITDSTISLGGVYFRIDEIDGIEYVYPYIVDCYSLRNSIEITDLEEAMIYKPTTDWDVIEYIEQHDLDMPYFKEKFELNDFVNQITYLQRRD